MMNVMKLVRFFTQSECAESNVSKESNRVGDLKPGHLCDSEASSDFRYFQNHRRWSQILVSSETEGTSYYGGISLKLLHGQRKESDLQICGLPCCCDTPSPSKEKKLVPFDSAFLSESYKMADRKASSSRPEKPKESSGNAVSRFIRRLSPTKRYRGDETPGASSSSTTQENASSSRKKNTSTKKDSFQKKDKYSEKLTKSFLNLPETTSSRSSCSESTSPWLTPAPSYQSLNQDDRATELKLLSQLHSNFDEATNILGNYISLRNCKK